MTPLSPQADLSQMHTLAEQYVSGRHWPIVILPPVNGRPVKHPTTKEWQKPNNLLQPGRASFLLQKHWNIGLLLRDLTDLDLDCPQARSAAALFLERLATGLIYGHASSPASHRLYRLTTPLPYQKFELPGDDRGALLELRSMLPAVNGSEPKAFQSVLPLSIHPDTGEIYQWYRYDEAALVNSNALWRAAHLIAITAALAKLHPPFDDVHKAERDEYRLAISGVLARMLPKTDAGNVFTTAMRIAGDRKDRDSIFQSTVQNLRENRPVKGIPGLVAIIGQKRADAILSWVEAIAEKQGVTGLQQDEPRYGVTARLPCDG